MVHPKVTSSNEDAGSDLDAFRRRCREFLEAHIRYDLPLDRDDRRGDVNAAGARAFQRELAAAGLAGLTYSTEYGGQGLGAEYEAVWREEAATFPLQTRTLAISQGMCLPVLNEFGTPAQKQAYMAKLISAEEMWAQMFSEPDAGSDVASLRMRAVRDGDRWVLNGTKVWTTLAHLCERGIALARSDPSVLKHQGLSMFIVDLRAVGVEITPIPQIDGRARFNQISLTDVEVPADHLIPPENGGWQLATAMLMYERVAIGGGQQGGIMTEWTDCLIDLARQRGLERDPVLRDGLARLYATEVTQSLLGDQPTVLARSGPPPGPSGSLGKLHRSRVAAMVRELMLQIAGMDGIAWTANVADGDRWAKEALGLISTGIAGGTDEVQRNIIGERVLGLPREPAVDRNVPFTDLIRSFDGSRQPARAARRDA